MAVVIRDALTSKLLWPGNVKYKPINEPQVLADAIRRTQEITYPPIDVVSDLPVCSRGKGKCELPKLVKRK